MINLLRQSRWVLLLLIPLSLFLNGCSLVKKQQQKQQQEQQAEQAFMLMPLLAIPVPLQNSVWLEKFTFSLTGNNTQPANKFVQQSMLLQSEFSQQEINIAAISFSGIPLAQAKWQVGSVQVETISGAAKNFNGEQVLHDMQITHWPIKTIRSALYANYRVEEQIIAGFKTRRFYHQAEVIIIISYQRNNVTFEQKKRAYRIDITRLEDNPLTIN